MTYSKPVSYSGLSLYKACPLLWKEAYIDGIREPSGPAADRGTQKHLLLEDYFNSNSCYPSGDSVLAPWQEFMEGLYKYNPVAEGDVAMDSDWKPVSFDDPSAHFRGKIDLRLNTRFFDWKTGKIYPEHVDQSDSYFALTEGTDAGSFVYLDQPLVVHTYKYTEPKRAEIREKLDESIHVLRNDQDFLPRMGPKCAWCKKSWRRGGDCKKAP